jgi:hypothetical protein
MSGKRRSSCSLLAFIRLRIRQTPIAHDKVPDRFSIDVGGTMLAVRLQGRKWCLVTATTLLVSLVSQPLISPASASCISRSNGPSICADVKRHAPVPAPSAPRRAYAPTQPSYRPGPAPVAHAPAAAAAALAIFQIGVQLIQSQAAAEEERQYNEAMARYNAEQQAYQDRVRRQRAAELAAWEARLRRHREAARLVGQANELFDGWATGPAIAAYEKAERLFRQNGDQRNLNIVRQNLASARLLHAALNDVDRVENARRSYGGDNPFGETSPFGPGRGSANAAPVVFRSGLDADDARRRAEASCAQFNRSAPNFRICADSAVADIVLAEDKTVSFQCSGMGGRSQRQACALREFERQKAVNEKACATGGCQQRSADADEQYVYWCPNEPGVYGAGRYVRPGAGCTGGAAPVRRVASDHRDKLRARLNAAIAKGESPTAATSAAMQDRIASLRQHAESLPPGKERDAILANLDAAAGGKAAPGLPTSTAPARRPSVPEQAADQAPAPDLGRPSGAPERRVSREEEILGNNPAWKRTDQLTPSLSAPQP